MVSAERFRRLRRGALGVDVGAALDLLGGVLKWVGLAFLAPAAVALVEGEAPWPFLPAGAITSAAGVALDLLTDERREERIGPREGFLVVALVWLTVPAFGALPFLFGDVPQLANPVDAYFEAMSGFTATGATVLSHVEGVGRAMLFWRQLSHWLGGMGIIVLAVAVLPRLRVGGRRLLQAELAGPAEIEPLTATIRQTARRLWGLYVGLSIVSTLVIAAFGLFGLDPSLNLFDAFSYATSAVALGGFSPRDGSASTLAPITQWALCLTMLISGINFLRLFRLLVQRQVRAVSRDEELRLYLFLFVLAAALLLAEVLADGGIGVADAVRTTAFQAVSTMTTTGLAVSNYTHWGALATMTLLLLMFVGASAGSTGGSIKVVRHLLLFRIIRRELVTAAHADMVVPIRINGVAVDERSLRSTIGFLALYVLAFALGSLGLVIVATRAHTGIDVFEAIGASASCLGNVGAAFGFAGPFGSYAPFSTSAKLILTAQMWLGRVEIIPVLVLFTRSFWRGPGSG
ncbi:MAG: TrkH family potassium uptake protein [Actinobacteria bacterium]|nr:TrkH family potassium uptake protein [Actinomycetota bacterium]